MGADCRPCPTELGPFGMVKVEDWAKLFTTEYELMRFSTTFVARVGQMSKIRRRSLAGLAAVIVGNVVTDANAKGKAAVTDPELV